jgi:hypothetical protein
MSHGLHGECRFPVISFVRVQNLLPGNGHFFTDSLCSTGSTCYNIMTKQTESLFCSLLFNCCVCFFTGASQSSLCMKSTVFWIVTPCSSEKAWWFEGALVWLKFLPLVVKLCLCKWQNSSIEMPH